MGFFKTVFQMIEEMQCEFVILGGDFNVVMEPKKDRNVNKCYHPKARDFILQKREEFQLIDIWRTQHPDERKFSWCKYDRSKKDFAWSRIDYMLVSECLINCVTDSEIKPGIVSDHSMISIGLQLMGEKRGKGIWKLNEQWMENEKYCETMIRELKSVLKTFQHLDGKRLWKMVKFEAANISKEFALQRKNKDQKNIYNLQRILCDLQEAVVEESENKEEKELINRNLVQIQAELQAYEDQKIKRVMFRSRSKYHMEGEKATKYYFNMEKRNYVNKTMYCVRKKNGELTYN